MTIDRRFLVARSLARLVRKERGTAGRAVEGYFASQGDRTHFVSIEPGHCHLVLSARSAEGARVEERTEVPRAQAEALLDVCSGKLAFDRSRVSVGVREAFLDRFMAPGPFDLLTVCFEGRADADAFEAPAWFGPEVTDDPAYEKRSFALTGVPELGEVALSDSDLDALLDALEGRAEAVRPQPRANGDGRSSSEVRVSEAFRRLAAATQEQAPPPPAEDELFATDSADPERAAAPDGADEPTAPDGAADGADLRIDHVMENLSQALGRPEWSDDEAEPRRPSVVELDRFGGRRQGQR